MVKLHMHGMLLSTAYNSNETAATNLYNAFTDIAWRFVHYLDRLPASKRPHARFMIGKFHM